MRKASLVVSGLQQQGNNPSAFINDTSQGLDLSNLHFRFSCKQTDTESPNNCSIRVYNLSDSTVKQIQGEYTTVTLQAGYENGNYGVIFSGTIKQLRIGREKATDSYVDILAADGDIAYNFGVINKTLASGNSSTQDVVDTATQAMNLAKGQQIFSNGGTLPRGKVLFGMSRAVIRNELRNRNAVWSIENGRVNIHPLDGYLDGAAVVLNSLTGLVGLPEQTLDGIKVRCLLNPKIQVGGLVHIDNTTVNQIVQQNPKAAPIAYNQWTGIQNLAKVTHDGTYRVFVAEYEGDTRGAAWYADLICLSVDPTTNLVKPYG